MQEWTMRMLVVFGMLLVLVEPGQAQTVPRTPWGDPDLQGLWNNATVAPLERPAPLANKPFWTEAEAADVEKTGMQTLLKGVAPEVPFSGELNEIWLEPGKVLRNRNTSMVIDPPDGKIPYTPEGKKRWDAQPTLGKLLSADSPEERALIERCIQVDPVLLPNPFYNNNHQIVQTPGYVVILSEVIHQARIIPLDRRPHADRRITQWFGDSRGRWEGQTLVVETTNFREQGLFRGATAALRLEERFTRVDAGTIDYQVKVTDPATFTRPWTAISTLRATAGPLYEYGCHEGNYSLPGILRGARVKEKNR
jgi:hypothetical protein